MSDLVGNPEDRFSSIVAHIFILTPNFYTVKLAHKGLPTFVTKHRLWMAQQGGSNVYYVLSKNIKNF